MATDPIAARAVRRAAAAPGWLWWGGKRWSAARVGARPTGASAAVYGPRAAAPAAPAPAAPAPLPTSLGQEATIQGYQDQITSLPGTYNPQRLALYAEGARGLTDQGYYDRATVGTRTTGADGTITYGIDGTGDGQAYRNAYQGIDNAANSRGALFGSAAAWGRQDAQTGLNNARDAVIRGLASRQDTLTADQAQARAQLGSSLGTAQGDYADWRAQQPVPPPTPASQDPAPSAKALAAQVASASKRPPGVWWGTGRYAAAIRRAR